jgi:hypothetical protein
MMTPDFAADAVEALRPYRHLAVRVLARAFLDLADGERPAERESARAFLAGSGLMCHWCRVAAVDPGWIIRRAEMVQRLAPRGQVSGFFQMGQSNGVSTRDTIHDS